MKNLKIIGLVVIITLAGIWSCSKNKVNPDKNKVTATERLDKIIEQSNNKSNLRTTNDHNIEQVKQRLAIAQTIGRNLKSVVTFDIIYNERTKKFRMENMNAQQQYNLPPDYDPNVEQITVDCIISGQDITTTNCDDTDCMLGAMADCFEEGGCAVVCVDRIIHIVFIPKNMS